MCYDPGGIPHPAAVVATGPGRCALPAWSPGRWSPTRVLGEPHPTTDLLTDVSDPARVTCEQTTPRPQGTPAAGAFASMSLRNATHAQVRRPTTTATCLQTGERPRPW